MKEIYIGKWKNSSYDFKYLSTKPDNLDNPVTIINTPSTYELQYMGICDSIDGVQCSVVRSVHPELNGMAVVITSGSFKKLIEADCIRFGKIIADFYFIYKGTIKLSLKD